MNTQRKRRKAQVDQTACVACGWQPFWSWGWGLCGLVTALC